MQARDDSKVAWGSTKKFFKTGSFKHEETGFIETPATKFDFLAPSYFIFPPGAHVSQLRTIGLGILAKDGIAWIGEKHNRRGWFTPSRDWELWIKTVLEECSDILETAGVLDVVKVTAKWIPCKSKDVCRAIAELFCPATNTFITPNSEVGFSLIEIRNVFGLPILGEFYDELVPLDPVIEKETKEF